MFLCTATPSLKQSSMLPANMAWKEAGGGEGGKGGEREGRGEGGKEEGGEGGKGGEREGGEREKEEEAEIVTSLSVALHKICYLVWVL